MRFPHYPHAALEYDLCDQDGILAWCEDGHSNSKDIVGPTAAQIVTEMVKQNYNHPSIVVWSMGNESNPQVADQCVPIAKALDPSRPVGVANQKSDLADFHTAHCYYGWYRTDMDGYRPLGFISEIGAGGVVTTHCDYGNADWKVGKYEPEEYQQIVSENNFQKSFHGDDSPFGHVLRLVPARFQRRQIQGPGGHQLQGPGDLRRRQEGCLLSLPDLSPARCSRRSGSPPSATSCGAARRTTASRSTAMRRK